MTRTALIPILVWFLSSSGIAQTEDAPQRVEDAAPYVLVLGTAQDAGLPQIGCPCQNCRRAMDKPAFRRWVTSILLADPKSGKRWLFDATPDLREQVLLARHHPPTRVEVGPRPPLFEGIFLTHAHMGHYTGLMYLGYESHSSKNVPVYGSKMMVDYLSTNGPWDQLVRYKNIRPVTVEPDKEVILTDRLSVTAVEVPHRREYTDTLAFVIRGPEKSLVYLPDIDNWEKWERAIEDMLREVDFALLDGCFYSPDEVPGRDLSEIPHPLITRSITRFASLSDDIRKRVYFTHLNHSNPVLDPEGEAAAHVRRAGHHVAFDGQRFDL